MDSLTGRGVTPPSIKRVANDGSPSQSRNGAPDLFVLFLYGPVNIEECYTGFDGVIRVAIIDLDDLVHALQIEDDGALASALTMT